MRFLITISAVIFAFNLALGQTAFTLQIYDSDSNKFVTGAYGEIQYNSSAITNQFAKTFYQGEYLTKEIKEGSINKMGNFNQLGLDANYGAYSSIRLKSFMGRNPYRLNWFIGLYDRTHTDLSVPENLFRLVFEGNKQFAGESIDISGFDFKLFKYQQLQTGLYFDNGLGQKIAFSASYLNGSRYLSYSVPQLSFFTSDIGDQIAMDWDFTYQQTNLENERYLPSNGYGFSTDLMYQFSYNSVENSNNYMKIEINDLGFINWSSTSQSITSSDSLLYEGYHIKNIQEIHDSLIQEISVDSIIDSHTYLKTGKFTTYLPTRISLDIKQQHNEKLAINIGISYRINSNYSPLLFVEEQYNITKNIITSGRLSYGGYTKLSFGMNIRAQFNSIGLFAGTNNIEGLIASKYFGGFSAFGGLNIRL